MTLDRYSGDPAIRITEQGASMKFVGGEVIKDQGLENPVTISLFTKKGWWGNTLVTEDAKRIGSEFEKIRTIVDVQTINDVRDAAKLAIQWMRDNGIISKADITVTNPRLDNIQTAIIMYPPGQDLIKFLFTKNGLHWVGQTLSPAHERYV